MDKKQTAPTDGREENGALLHDEIAKLAYALWEARGAGHGYADQDWLEAERRLREMRLQEAQSLQTKSQAA